MHDILSNLNVAIHALRSSIQTYSDYAISIARDSETTSTEDITTQLDQVIKLLSTDDSHTHTATIQTTEDALYEHIKQHYDTLLHKVTESIKNCDIQDHKPIPELQKYYDALHEQKEKLKKLQDDIIKCKDLHDA